MSEQTDNIANLVKPYGLSDEESRVYLFLLKKGFQTALAISRELHVGRTKVYNLIDKLRKKELVEFRVNERGMTFIATDPQKFQQLISLKEKEIAALKSSLPELVFSLTRLMNNGSDSDSKVLYYEGNSGLEQVSYNLTKANDVIRVFEMEHLSDFLSRIFAEEVRQKLVNKKIFTRDLTNKKSFGGFTDVQGMIPHYNEFRYIDPQHLKINFETLIYNDVYAIYSYKNSKIFCVEIYNKQLAEMQKQIFDYIWKQAVPMKFLDQRGAAKVMDSSDLVNRFFHQ